MYANPTVMILLNLNYFLITQAELYLKGTFVTASFMLVTIFRYLWKPWKKRLY